MIELFEVSKLVFVSNNVSLQIMLIELHTHTQTYTHLQSNQSNNTTIYTFIRIRKVIVVGERKDIAFNNTHSAHSFNKLF